jgi:hypothetical protein
MRRIQHSQLLLLLLLELIPELLRLNQPQLKFQSLPLLLLNQPQPLPLLELPRAP